MSNAALPPNDQEMTLVQHLLDLKTSLTRGILAIIVFFIILFPFANDIYTYISEPLTRYLPEGTSMIATAVASPFLTPFKLSFVLAIYLAMPFLLYQLWRFIAPALYKHERQLVATLLFFSSFLFYSGGLFAYYVVFPLVFGFLSQSAPEGVTIATDIALYLDFVIKMFFAFGMAFEVPIVTILLIITGMTKPEKLSHARPYIVVGAFVIGMLLTPPDIISQTLLAVPMWLLFELGLIIGAMIIKRRKTDENEEDTPPEPNDSSNTKAQENQASTQPSNQSTPVQEYEFDDRYADQVDDDLDWDDEFDKIDSEMAKLERDYETRQKADKEKSKNEYSNDNQKANTSPDTATAEKNDVVTSEESIAKSDNKTDTKS
ncbi:twin-arginine translocase subunit TatC [Thiomicrorhabdus sp. Kp2]|uniref:twin-arginine translocase subunit TatC n=1 Tax=Thiomicrorhabdus sp. Kp2 TaxID=1123518 RepID=UPI0004215342|nr:twin-arginine translocase subunit TatC [Thiomicrorhabdus sp. Kp2]